MTRIYILLMTIILIIVVVFIVINGGGKRHKWVGFICTKLLNELSSKVPIAQVLEEINRFSNPEQPGLSSSIRLEVVYI